MLLIRTEIKETLNKGIGLFSLEKIQENQKIWIHEENFSKIFQIEDVNKMNIIQKEFLYHYGSNEKNNILYLDLDNTRFMNHSYNPTVLFINDEYGITLTNIEIGDELTCNYEDIYTTPIEFEIKK